MFYKFNSLRGRLIPASQGASVNPQGLKPLKIKEAPVFESKVVSPARVEPVVFEEAVSVASAYNGPQLGRVPIDAKYRTVMALQELFLKNDGLLVWQKRGMRDKLPLMMTLTGCILGTCFAFHNLYVMSFPQKSD